ncbi:tape measure protein [Enterobacteriaceae bacterium YMB-R22]|uniref:tape measure protein n=1 Tax=Tenebrionicola larvae TaxID=2815733 RepID=UPI0020127FC7|nr:tape measure protein [Tenebrionicola larvae]MBV4411325.1 tape measure protein [Tenebrionicola larvae]
MAGRNSRASIIIDLMGNIAQRSRQFSGSIDAMARSSRLAMLSMRTGVIELSNAIDRLGATATGVFSGIATGARSLTGAGYTAKKFFIDIASTRENQRIALNSLYKGDKARAQKMMDWATQNAKNSAWGLTGVLQAFTSSKASGMSDKGAQDFVTMLEGQSALKGWDLSAARGASTQLKQMFARQQITDADASVLSGYGINVYKTLAEATGKSEREVRKLAETGKLGAKSMGLVFQLLKDEAKGAQDNAMNTWTGLTVQLGNAWEGFADKLMNKGPFERLKNQLRSVLAWYERISKPDVHGISELDRFTDRLAIRFNATFDAIQSGARKAWRVGRQALLWVDDNIVSLKKLAAVIGGIWLANKAARMGAAIVRPAWNVATSPYRGYKWLRNRRNGGAPALPGMIPGSQTVQPVFVTNWPVGGMGGGDVYTGNGRRKRGPGRGSSRRVPVSPSLPAAVPKKAGIFSRMFSGAGNALSGAGKAVGGWLGSAGKWLGGTAVGRIASKGAKALGWLGKAGGGLARRLGGPALSAVMLAPTLLDDNTSLHDKGGAVGSTAGAWVGGAIGSLAGPLGTVAGATLGGVVGDYLGGFVADMYSKWDSKDPAPPQEQKVEANARLQVELADGLRLTSTTVNESGMGLNVYTGSNFIPGF